ncbi:MAG: peptide chain release factor N(5)-glutamine methyltransferase [Bdellovibrionales bacterium]
MQLAVFLRNAGDRLEEAGVDNPQLDARLLAGHALGLDRAELLSQSRRLLTAEEMDAIEALLAQRVEGKPVARIIGKREFWSLDFLLNEATLEPRPDSETLVEAIIKLGKNGRTILDLGTGTGCLLLSLLHEMPESTGIGVDISRDAVHQAAKNAISLCLTDRAEFRVSNWLSDITEKFDIIISNPPYVSTLSIPKLMREVRKYDPKLALDGGRDGLSVYRLLIPQLAAFLNPHGLVAFEVGQKQAPKVADLLRKNGFTNIAAHKDLSGIERCVTASL